MQKVEELNTDEMNAVVGGVISPTGPVDHIGIDPNTGQIVEYDREGNVIRNDPSVWY